MTATFGPITDQPSTTVYPVADGYPRRHRVRIVRVPERRYLAIQGESAPGEAEFQAAMSALYGVGYGLHFLLRERGVEAHLGPPECLWERRDGRSGWTEGTDAFEPRTWRWTLMLAMPDEADGADLDAAFAGAARKRSTPALARLAVKTLDEGLVVEAMHVGPYATEPETLARMHEAATAAGLSPHGAHHEIYLGDPRRSLPGNLRTVLRQPVH
jgi:hypothetical protein